MKTVLMKALQIENENWRKVTLIGIGLSMIASAIAVGIAHGFSFPKLLFGFFGLLMLAAAKLGRGIVPFYKSAAVILLNTLVLLVFLEIGAATVMWLWPHSSEIRSEDGGYNESQEWGAAFLRDSGNAPGFRYEPYVIWKKSPYESELLGVDKDGNRVTPGAKCGKDSYNVFMFGGSTMWGENVPDWGTIPAYVQTQMTALHKEPVCVRNFGQSAWVSTQSVIELLRQLQAGEKPNLVIFYDGVNDVGVANSQGIAGSHDDVAVVRSRLENEAPSRTFIQLLGRMRAVGLLERLLPMSAAGDWSSDNYRPNYDPEILGEKVTRSYLTNYRAVRAMASDFSFEYAFFWQPMLNYEFKPLTAEEKQIEKIQAADNRRKLIDVVYSQVKASTHDHDHIFYIADIFNSTTEWVYVDEAHLTPSGNEKVANRIMELLVRGNDSSAKSTKSETR